MRHLKAGRKFGRNPSHRRAMLRNLTANLICHERIETTDAKAKELRRVAERLITKAVRLGDIAYEKPGENADRSRVARRLHVERQIRAYIPRFGVRVDDEGGTERIDLVEKVMIDLAKRFQGRPGGYTRIIKLGPRRGDNAPMSLIEFVAEADSAEGVKKAEAAKAEPEKAEPATEEQAE
ncbi:MAG: 50S ribosomal protein L17 [Myxococcota bacterium]